MKDVMTSILIDKIGIIYINEYNILFTILIIRPI